MKRSIDIKARMKAAGECVSAATKHRESVYKVKCQGCGKEIRSDEELGEVDYVKTKRGTELFFHRACAGNVWSHGIV